jgi:molybdopterin converting factor small subunit
MAKVTVRYWAAAKDAAGVAEDTVTAETLAAALEAARGQLAPDRAGRLGAVLARSSLLVDGQQVGSRDPAAVRLADAAVIEILPPFAGG